LQKIVLNCYERVNNLEIALQKKAGLVIDGEKGVVLEERKGKVTDRRGGGGAGAGKKKLTYEEELEQAERDAERDAQMRYNTKNEGDLNGGGGGRGGSKRGVHGEGILSEEDEPRLEQDNGGLDVIRDGPPVDYSTIFKKGKTGVEDGEDGEDSYDNGRTKGKNGGDRQGKKSKDEKRDRKEGERTEDGKGGKGKKGSGDVSGEEDAKGERVEGKDNRVRRQNLGGKGGKFRSRSKLCYSPPKSTSYTTPYSSSSQSTEIFTSPYEQAGVVKGARVTLPRTPFASLVNADATDGGKTGVFTPPPGVSVGPKGLSWLIRMIRLLIDDKQLADIAADKSRYLAVRPRFPLFGMIGGQVFIYFLLFLC
jgi:hypothetical protein